MPASQQVRRSNAGNLDNTEARFHEWIHAALQQDGCAMMSAVKQGPEQ